MVTVKLTGIEAAMRAYDPARVSQAAKLAINETVKKIHTDAISSIRNEQGYNIKAADLRKKVKITARASVANLAAVVTASGRPISLSYFGATQYRGRTVKTRGGQKTLKRRSSKSGVYVTIKRGEKTHLTDAFIAPVKATYKNGDFAGFHIGVFRRMGDKRLKIAEKRVVTIASMYGNARTERAIRKAIDGSWNKRFNHHLSRLIK
ncbi:phage tail protein [Desulfuromonas sp. KJ2020]|uniref:phage tail protein n=1 Tax=Desulfuromonas sp. KJ2020 TaxID=2919173 RepID=UPI0020A72A9D|nr:phage tail protein [Desulfuromonas sp. KJ2020]MCP3177276.1 phage tail protein [Desulfuromonas sp. KJ2020]